jgi:hypothetical protein
MNPRLYAMPTEIRSPAAGRRTSFAEEQTARGAALEKFADGISLLASHGTIAMSRGGETGFMLGRLPKHLGELETSQGHLAILFYCVRLVKCAPISCVLPGFESELF